MFQRLTLISSVLLAAALSPLLPAAVTIHHSVEASHDNNIQASAATNTTVLNSESANLQAKFHTDTNARNIYVKFDVADYLVSNQAATFTIRSAGANSFQNEGVTSYANWVFDLYALNAGAPKSDWTESTLSLSTAPAYVHRLAPESSQVTLLGTFNQANVSAANAVYSVTFDQLERFVQSDNTATFILLARTQSNASPSFSFASSEHASIDGPTLSWVVPEPSQALLVSLGLGWCVLRRRKSA